MKIFFTILGAATPAIVMVTICFLIFNWSVLSAKDIYRIPQRFIRKITMNDESNAEITIKEYAKLRKMVDSLNLPLRDKQSILWNIEYGEKSAVDKITYQTRDRILNDIRSKIET